MQSIGTFKSIVVYWAKRIAENILDLPVRPTIMLFLFVSFALTILELSCFPKLADWAMRHATSHSYHETNTLTQWSPVYWVQILSGRGLRGYTLTTYPCIFTWFIPNEWFMGDLLKEAFLLLLKTYDFLRCIDIHLSEGKIHFSQWPSLPILARSRSEDLIRNFTVIAKVRHSRDFRHCIKNLLPFQN